MDEIIRDLRIHGARRAKARATTNAESKLIAALAVQALERGLTKQEIATLAQISRPALDTMLKQ